MTPPIRYLLLQVPGTVLVGALLWWSVSIGFLGAVTAVVIFAVWVLKDTLLYPAFRRSIRPAPPTGGEALVGREGALVRAVGPRARGQVQFDGELWSVRSRHGERIAVGEIVRVVGAEGLILAVERVGDDQAHVQGP